MLLEEGALFAERYQLVKLLGRGGFSEVWMANDTKSSSDNSSVATVSSSGVVKAVRSGNATIWAEGENGDLQYCKVIVEEAKTIETIPYEQVDVKPTFQNGDLNQFAHWVSENITYPTDALKRKVQGLVKIRFIVDTDGSVAGVKVLVSADSALDAEAKKVISQSPKWKPGSMDGKPARQTPGGPQMLGKMFDQTVG